MNADPLWSCVMLVCGPLRYLVIPLPQYYSFRFYVELVHVREVVQSRANCRILRVNWYFEVLFYVRNWTWCLLDAVAMTGTALVSVFATQMQCVHARTHARDLGRRTRHLTLSIFGRTKSCYCVWQSGRSQCDKLHCRWSLKLITGLPPSSMLHRCITGDHQALSTTARFQRRSMSASWYLLYYITVSYEMMVDLGLHRNSFMAWIARRHQLD